MSMQPPEPLFLNYATPEPDDSIPFVKPMRRWRAIAGWCLCAAIWCLSVKVLGVMTFWPITAAALFGLFVAVVMTLIYMARAATREVGISYATRQVSLAVLLLPVLLLGVFVVPLLVQADLENWRAAENREDVDTTI